MPVKDSFRGGVHPAGRKDPQRTSPLQTYEAAGDIVLPLSQHIGKPAKPIVKKGDSVLTGQLIAEADGFISANIISSCSGTVKAIEKRRTIAGTMQECIVIENDGKFTETGEFGRREDISALSRDEIIAKVKAAGIVGLGGAGFPTHVKLMPKEPEKIKYVIANGAECEPCLTGNDRLMRERPNDIVEGLKIILSLFPNAEGVIAIEKNKPEAIEAMKKASAKEERISVLPLKTKYPQGGERSLISVIAGIDFPITALPADVGCIVDNVGTIYAVQRAVVFGEPLFTGIITVSGDAVKKPANLIVRNGTSVSELVEACGGIIEGATLKKALAGGPMMGFAFASLDVPAVKTTNGITLLAEDACEKAEKQETACLHCGRCTTVCPQGLLPQLMADAVYIGDLERYEKKLYGLECIACGSCTYVCPAKRPLTQTFKETKAEIMALKRLAAGGKK